MRGVNLSREKVLAAAFTIADTKGLSALTMRALASAVGVEPMSLYYHVNGKEDILDGIMDAVYAEMTLPRPDFGADGGWRAEIRIRSISMRQAFNHHPWALALMSTCVTHGPATLTHYNAMLGTFRAGGFTAQQIVCAYAVIDSYVFGFALQETSSIGRSKDGLQGLTRLVAEGPEAMLYPHYTAFANELRGQSDYTFADFFEFGLDTVLDGIAGLVSASE